jgi:hypothetical protein
MQQVSEAGQSSLETLARGRFDRLSEAERRLLEAVPRGERAYGGPEDLGAPENNPENADRWEPDREIRSALLRWLCTEPAARAQVDPSGIRLAGVRLDDQLTLSFVMLPFPLWIGACWFPKGLALDGTDLPALTLSQSWIGPLKSTASEKRETVAILADSTRVKGLFST